MLKQPQYQPMTAEKEVMILFAGANGYLDQWPVEAISDYEKQMLGFIESKHPEILGELKEKNQIGEELEKMLKKALDDFKGIYQPAV